MNEKMRTITAVTPLGEFRLRLLWSDGTEVEIDFARAFAPKVIAALNGRGVFAAVKIGDWGHSLEWPNGIDMSANRFWMESLSVLGPDDERQFLEWRHRNGLSLSKAAEALGLSRRTIAYYSNGERKIPKAILLACTGWEAGRDFAQAA